MNTINGSLRCKGQVSTRMLAFLVAGLILVLAAVYWLTREPEVEPVPAPAGPLETVEPAQSAVERGDSARDIIDELKSSENGIDYAVAYERASQFRAEGRSADAQLLYFFAARGGHGPAAFDLASSYDPNHQGESSLMNEPDPFQAYRWYQRARDAGEVAAEQRLAELRGWAEQAAGAGDAEAERLLLQWE